GSKVEHSARLDLGQGGGGARGYIPSMPGPNILTAGAERARAHAGSAPVTLAAISAAGDDRQACFHCGLPNPVGPTWHATWDSVERWFCCAGCLGVAQTIHAAGLDGFYRRCGASRGAPPPASGDRESVWVAAAAEAAGLVLHLDGERREISLLLEGMHCPACIWLSETYLLRQPGVLAVRINFATRRARVQWDSRQTQLCSLLQAVAAIGYRAHPYDPARREASARKEARGLLLRMALALLAMMQVMMFA